MPEALAEAHPFFQWFSPAQVFDFALYRVRDDRQPAVAVRGIAFVYYSSEAPALEDGTACAERSARRRRAGSSDGMYCPKAT